MYWPLVNFGYYFLFMRDPIPIMDVCVCVCVVALWSEFELNTKMKTEKPHKNCYKQ